MNRKFCWNAIEASILATILVLGFVTVFQSTLAFSAEQIDVETSYICCPVLKTLTIHVNPSGHGSDKNFKVKIYKKTLTGWSYVDTTDAATWTHSFIKGRRIKLVAVNSGRFDGWEGSETGSSTTIEFKMCHDKEITAYFLWEVAVIMSPGGSVSLSPYNNCSYCSGHYYRDGTYVSATATPNSGYSFDYWTVNGWPAGSSNPIGHNIHSDHTIEAVFTKVWNLHVNIYDEDSASLSVCSLVGVSPTDNNGKTSAQHGDVLVYDDGTSVTLSPNTPCTPCDKYVFDHWGSPGDCSGIGNCVLTMDQDRTASAFYWKVKDLNVVVVDEDGNPLGCQINLGFTSPAGASQAPDPDGNYGNGATINDLYKYTTVIASPPSCSGYRFDHWELTGASGDPSSGFQMGDSDVTLKAVCWTQVDLTLDIEDDQGAAIGATLHLTFTPPGGATSPNVPSDGDYGNGVLTMDKGAGVSAAANSYTGYQFDHWTSPGSCSGGTGTCSFTMTSDTTLGALYWKWITLNPDIEDDQGTSIGATLALSFTAPSGVVQPNAVPSDGSYGNAASLQMYRGSDVSATPNAYTDHKFDHWTSGCSGTGGCALSNIQTDTTLGALYWKLVDLSIAVKDDLGASIGCAVSLDFTPPAGAQNSPIPEPDGNYVDGSAITDLYRGTDVAPTTLSCTDYRFDHWTLDGGGWSGSSFSMSGDRALKAVYWKQFILTIEASPSGTGNTGPLVLGVYALDRGTYVNLVPVPHAGYQFSHWTYDGTDTGSISISNLHITMNSDHHAIANFEEEETPLIPTLPVAAPVYEGCILPLDFPSGMKYKGMQVDLQFNEDLLRRLAGKAGPSEDREFFLLGGSSIVPYPWEHYDVHFEANALRIGDQVYEAEYGYKDYGAILIDCDKMMVRIAGVNRFGTRAGLMWVLNHPGEFSGKLLVVVEWVDSNHDHYVQDGEIGVIYSLP